MMLSAFIWEIFHPFQTIKVRVRKPLQKYINRIFNSYKERTSEGVNNIRDILLKVGVVALILSIIIWISIFMYVAFYYSYMPNITHSRPVHFQYKSCDGDKGICSFPTAHIRLTKRQQLLMVGQAYKISVNLDMPESEVNKNLGMFMCCIELRSRGGTLAASSCRSGLLSYRSPFLSFITSAIMSPFIIFGTHREKQTVQLELFSAFEDDQMQPITDAYVEVQSRHIEIYSAALNIDAHFTGLRYVMFNWPYISAAIGVTTNLLFLALVFALSWYHLQPSEDEEGEHESESKPFDRGTEKNIFENDDFTQDSISIKQEEDSEDSVIEESLGSTEMVNVVDSE